MTTKLYKNKFVTKDYMPFNTLTKPTWSKGLGTLFVCFYFFSLFLDLLSIVSPLVLLPNALNEFEKNDLFIYCLSEKNEF